MTDKTESQCAMEGLSTEASSLIDLLCEDCGKKFTRESYYLNLKRSDPLFKWTCAKCDVCKEIKISNAFKNMPKILQSLRGNP